MGIKIQKVKIKDFKVIKDLEKEINGKSVFLMAENGRGKSSFLQAIQIALGNSDVVPQNMTGEGVVEVTKDGQPYTFAFKTGKDGKPKLTVTLPNGLREDKKGIIGGIVGSLSFDINEFVSLSESTAGKKKQVEMFKSLLPKEFIEGLHEFEVKVKNLYEERTEVNRKADTLEGFIRESKLFGDDLKTKPVDISTLQADIEKGNQHNNKIADVKKRADERAAKILEAKCEVVKLKEKIAELESAIAIESETQAKAEEWLKNADPVDISNLISQMNNASEINVKAAQAEEHNKKLKAYNELKEQAGDLTVQIDVNKQAISDAIKDFDSPVKGLSFTDTELIYNGVPVSINNLSTSEIIHLGIQMKFASNPDCGLLFIEHGESLGSQRLKEVLDYCREHDIQAFFEEVKRGQDELTIEFIDEE
jgi:predicted ATP-dependent endonuclease of OLD family